MENEEFTQLRNKMKQQLSDRKFVVPSGATYRFYHRPEGWSAICEVGEYKVEVKGLLTEAEAISTLNMALGFDGMIKYRFDGGIL